MKQEPPLDAKCKDKFLVQSVAITADKEFANTGSIVRSPLHRRQIWHTDINKWQHVDDADKASVQEKKIRVVYLAAEGAGLATTPLRSNVNGISSVSTPVYGRLATTNREQRESNDTAPPSYSSNRSPSPEEHFTPDTRRTTNKIEDHSTTHRASNQAATTFSNATTAVANATPSYDELKAKLAEAQTTIANYAQEGGVRLRKVAKGETDNQTVNDVAQRVQQSQGVPLQIVAALCLLSFLLAYLFF